MNEQQLLARGYLCPSFIDNGVMYAGLDCRGNETNSSSRCCGSCIIRSCCSDSSKQPYINCPRPTNKIIEFSEDDFQEPKAASPSNSSGVSLNTIVESTTLSISILIGVLLLLAFWKRKLHRSSQVNTTAALRLPDSVPQIITSSQNSNELYPRFTVTNSQVSILPPAYDACIIQDPNKPANEPQSPLSPQSPPPLYPNVWQQQPQSPKDSQI